jgi:hypothetical protein
LTLSAFVILNAHMAGVPLSQVQARRQRLLDLLPEHDWSIPKAGMAAGYTPAYARRRLPAIIKGDVAFCEQILAKRQVVEATTADRREKALQRLDSIASDPKSRPI